MAIQPDGPDQFELARKRASAQNNAAVQGQQDALKRRFASLGSVNSGAAIKQNQMVAERGQENLAAVNQNIDAAQTAEFGRKAELQANRDFARSERLGSQDFMGSQAELGRKFSTSERLGSQAFAAGENATTRKIQQQQYDADMKFRKSVQESANSQFADQMDLANRQFAEDRATTQFNKDLAAKGQKKSFQDILSNPQHAASTILTGDMSPVTDLASGGKIICTEYCRQGWISEEILTGDLEFAAKHLTRETRANYLMWAQYVVPVMQRHPILLYLFWPITYNWVHYMAWKMGRYAHKPLFGPFVEWSATHVSNVLGKTIRKIKMHRRYHMHGGI